MIASTQEKESSNIPISWQKGADGQNKGQSQWVKQQPTSTSDTSQTKTSRSKEASVVLSRIVNKRQAVKMKVLMTRKIKDIKEKYYGRESEIGIYEEEKAYETQLKQIQKIEKQVTDNPQCVSQQNVCEIIAIKELIIARISKLKENQPSNSQ